MSNQGFLGKVLGRFFPHEDNTAKVTVHEGWTLSLTGVITELSKVNVDKSGRNPKYMVYGSIDWQHSDLQGGDFTIPNPLHFTGKEKEIIAQVGKELVIGEQVTLSSRGVETPVDRFVIQ